MSHVATLNEFHDYRWCTKIFTLIFVMAFARNSNLIQTLKEKKKNKNEIRYTKIFLHSLPWIVSDKR